MCACAQILDQGNSAFSSQQYSVAIPFFNFVQNVTRTCNLVPRPAAVFASQFGPDSDDLTELATIDDSTAYYIAPDVLSDTNAYEAANNDTGDLLGADQGEAALDFYGSPYSNLPNCASLNAQVGAFGCCMSRYSEKDCADTAAELTVSMSDSIGQTRYSNT